MLNFFKIKQNFSKAFLNFFLTFLLFTPISLLAAPLYKENVDYTLVNSASSTVPSNNKKIQVIEFFNYGCPACNRFEPYLEKWLAKNKDKVDFKRVPVVFESGWQNLAKTYYLAQNLGIEKNLSPKIFNAIHQKGQNLTNLETLKAFLSSQGISPEKFNNTFNSPSLNLELNLGEKAMRDYHVFEIPTIIIAGKYKTSAGLTQGNDQKLIEIVGYLVNKTSQMTNNKAA